MRWDLFCQVIDNHGDAGVCWRVAAELAARGEQVRLWIDQPAVLDWMAPGGARNVEILPWNAQAAIPEPGDVVVEAFGCNPPDAFIARMAASQPASQWLNLEYLSAEGYVERSHGLPSPVMHGPGAGLVKRFVYPGFTARTAGLLREADLPARRAAFDRHTWLRQWGVQDAQAQVASLFCYEPPALADLLQQLQAGPSRTELLVTAGRAAAAVRALGVGDGGQLRLRFLPLLAQRAYDHLLWSCDLNFVRGEDSVVRALLAGVPCVWQAYPQGDGAHHAKLEAFLQWLQPPPDLRDLFRVWNGVAQGPLPAVDVAGWRECARAAGERAHALPELGAELMRLVSGRARI
jgi:uncharacterized repeat protein (TIGR03837 family)